MEKMGSLHEAEAPEGRSIIYVVRHGECMGNISRKNLHPDEAVLTDNGKLQAKLLGQLLSDVKFTLAHTSDYARALETAQIILSESSFSKDIPLEKNVKLREKYLGAMHENGAGTVSILTAFQDSGEDFLDWAAPGAETRAVIESKIESFFQEIFEKVDTRSEAETILSVSHGATILHIIAYLSRSPNKYHFKNWLPEMYKLSTNTGFFKFAIQKNPRPNEPRELEILIAHGNAHLLTLGSDTLHKLTLENEKMKSFKGCTQQ